MERKHIIGAAIVIAMISAIGMGFWLAEDASPSEVDATSGTREHRRTRTSSRSSLDDERERQEVIAWEERAGEMPLTGAPRGESPGESSAQPEDERSLMPPPEDPSAARSAGWRLGRARAELVTVERRIERIREALANLENGGDPAVIARQREILTRFEERHSQLEDETRTLETQAEGDGTFPESEQGYAENLREERPALHSGAPPG